MDLIKLSMSADFVLARARMTWREIEFGLANALIDRRAAIEFALDDIARVERPSIELIELADARPNDVHLAQVEALAAMEPALPLDEVRDKWLYLTLAWLYEERATLADPLDTIERVYSDFDYPALVESFVRYMPADDVSDDRAENERRMMARWKDYLDATAPRYRP